MPRGAPDYSNVRTPSLLHRVDDLGELAARLGSPVTHDRAGYVVLVDSFENGSGMWYRSPPASDSDYVVSSDRQRTGSFSLKLTPPSDSSYKIAMVRYLPYPAAETLGLSMSFTLDSKTDYIETRLRVYDGALYHRCDLRYDNTNKRIMYLDDGLVWRTLSEDILLSMSSRLFHTLKFTINLDDKQYTRVVINSTEFKDLELDYPTTSSVIAPYLMGQYALWATDDTQPVTYLDDIIVTQAEP